MNKKPSALGITGNVLLLLVLLIMLGVGWLFYRGNAILQADKGWVRHLPSHINYEYLAEGLASRVKSMMLNPALEDEPRTAFTFYAEEPSVPSGTPHTIADSISMKLTRLAKTLNDTTIDRDVRYRDYLWREALPNDSVFVVYVQPAGDPLTKRITKFHVALMSEEHFRQTLLQQAFQSFLATRNGGTLSGWIDQGLVEVSMVPRDDNQEKIVLAVPSPLKRMAIEDRNALVGGKGSLGGLGDIWVRGVNSETLTHAVSGAFGWTMLILWLIVFVAVIMMMSRIRKLSREVKQDPAQ